jgi:hypothetical protein
MLLTETREETKKDIEETKTHLEKLQTQLEEEKTWATQQKENSATKSLASNQRDIEPKENIMPKPKSPPPNRPVMKETEEQRRNTPRETTALERKGSTIYETGQPGEKAKPPPPLPPRFRLQAQAKEEVLPQRETNEKAIPKSPSMTTQGQGETFVKAPPRNLTLPQNSTQAHKKEWELLRTTEESTKEKQPNTQVHIPHTRQFVPVPVQPWTQPTRAQTEIEQTPVFKPIPIYSHTTPQQQNKNYVPIHTPDADPWMTNNKTWQQRQGKAADEMTRETFQHIIGAKNLNRGPNTPEECREWKRREAEEAEKTKQITSSSGGKAILMKPTRPLLPSMGQSEAPLWEGWDKDSTD